MKLEKVRFYPSAAQPALPAHCSIMQVQALLDRARNATDDDEERTLVVGGMDVVTIDYDKKLTAMEIASRRIAELERENVALRNELAKRGG